MRVRCTINKVRDLTASQREHFSRYAHLDRVGFNVGDLVPVFGVIVRDGLPWYLVCEDPQDEYPVPHFSAFFEVVEARVDPDWCLAMQTNVGDFAFLPPVWAVDPDYMEGLVDGHSDAIKYFEKLKARYYGEQESA